MELLKTAFIVLGALLMTATFGIDSAQAEVDYSIYSNLLKKYVKNGVVDYRGLKSEEAKLDSFLDVLKAVKTKSLTRDRQYAFYINAYNAWTIKLILTKYPKIKSIKDIGGFLESPWKMKIVKIDGRVMTLDNVEHKILRPRFKDYRVHAAVNCASKSCPPLLNRPFLGKTIDRQLDEVFRAFINDSRRNRLDGSILWISKIFDWFEDDFSPDVMSVIIKYSEGDLKETLKKNKNNIRIKYLDYDWSLNTR